MDTKKHYFSKENTMKLCTTLSSYLNNDDDETLKMCYNLLKKEVMPAIWNEYQGYTKKYPLEKLIPHINKKSIELCKRIINDQKKRAPSSKSTSRLQRQTMPIKKREISGMDSIGGYASYNNDINGEFIRADGGIGSKFKTNVDAESFLEGDAKRSATKELAEARFQEMINARKMDNMGKKIPEEPNFRVDGTDSRKKKDTSDQKMEQYNMMQTFQKNNDDVDEDDIDYINRHEQHNEDTNDYEYQMHQFSKTPQSVVTQEQFEQMTTMFQQVVEMVSQMAQRMDNSEIETSTQISKNLRESVAHKLGIDVQRILHMSSDQIEKLLNDKNGKDTSSESENEDDIRERELKKKIELAKKNVAEKQRIMEEQAKKQQKETPKTQQKETPKTQQKETPKTQQKETPKTQQKETSKTQQKETSKTQQKETPKTQLHDSSDSSDSTSITSDTETKSKPIIKKISPITKKRQIRICSDKCISNPIYYNDYLVEFKEHYDNLKNGESIPKVKKIILDKINIQFMCEITDESNALLIYTDEDEEPEDAILEKGEFPLNEILDELNESFESDKITFVCENNVITVSHIDGDNFVMDYSYDNSIGKLFGFDKKKYHGSSSYTADRCHAFNTKPIYMYIKNICANKPFAKINPDGTFEQYVFDLDAIIDLSMLVIQFRNKNVRNDKNDKYELVNFGKIPHTIDLTFEIV
jgi:hypothetical protein